MGLFNYKYRVQIDPSPNTVKEKIDEMRARTIRYLKSNDHAYGELDYNARYIGFSNQTIHTWNHSFKRTKAFEVKFKANQKLIRIEGSFRPTASSLLGVGLLIIVSLIVHLTFGLILLGVSTVLFVFNCLAGASEIRNIIDRAVQAPIQENLEISQEQQGWLEDPTKCPACGYDLESNDTNCPDCGIVL